MPTDGLKLNNADLPPATRVPVHIGIIMDGNGRWASARGLPRTEGHRAGIKALRNAVDLCVRTGVQYLTIFSFSSENWARPRDEISFIFNLMRRFVASDVEKLVKRGVRVLISGERDGLDPEMVALIERVEQKTRDGKAMVLVVAFNYGGKTEIAHAARRIAAKALAGDITLEKIDENLVAENLYLPDVPDPDLIIRTSGEKRLSNFLLWQSAYAELVFLDTYWPDFDAVAFAAALEEFNARDRRFGAVKSGAK